MDKRGFRQTQQPSVDRPGYPTLDTFDASRRRFLARLGAAVVGAGIGATLLPACGDGRTVGGDPDAFPPPQGVAPMPDAQLDTRPPEPDGMIAGGAPMPDAQLDTQPWQPDGMEGGVAPMPDAKVDKLDAGVPKADFTASPGYAPMMDAQLDEGGSSDP